MRPETGVMQFEDDWPGVFIRGDNAIAIALHLGAVLRCIDAGLAVPAVYLARIKSLLALLDSCDARNKPQAQRARLVTAEEAAAR